MIHQYSSPFILDVPLKLSCISVVSGEETGFCSGWVKLCLANPVSVA